MGEIRHEQTSLYWKKGTNSNWDKQNNKEKRKGQDSDFGFPTKSPFLASMSSVL